MSENRKKGNTFFVFMEDVASNLKSLGKIRTSETYKSSLDSFRKFRKGKDLTFRKFNPKLFGWLIVELKRAVLKPQYSPSNFIVVNMMLIMI